MAKKAGSKSITWGLLEEAKACADSAFRSRELAERQLTKWLLAGELPWRSDILEGSKRDCDPGSGDPEFWREPVPPSQAGNSVVILDLQPFLIITWDESWVRRRWDYTASYTFYRIEVAMDNLTELLPAGSIRASAVGKDALSPKAWLTAEVKRMKAAREIPSGITKTELATLLEGRIKAAALRGGVTKSVGYRHIVNNLEAWDLWSIIPTV